MTHLTANTTATAVRRNSASPIATDRHTCKHLLANIASRRLPIRLESIFRNRVANCLEVRRAGFHYSVIGRHATGSLAFQYVASCPLNDEVTASKSEVADPCAHAQGGDEQCFNPIGPVPFSNRRKKD